MLDEWIGLVVGAMHRWRISINELSMHMGLTPQYVSMVLNGHRSPEGAEQKFKEAVKEIISDREVTYGQDEKRPL